MILLRELLKVSILNLCVCASAVLRIPCPHPVDPLPLTAKWGSPPPWPPSAGSAQSSALTPSISIPLKVWSSAYQRRFRSASQLWWVSTVSIFSKHCESKMAILSPHPVSAAKTADSSQHLLFTQIVCLRVNKQNCAAGGLLSPDRAWDTAPVAMWAEGLHRGAEGSSPNYLHK